MAKKPLNVALFGTKFMGKAHSNAYRQVNAFMDPPQPLHMKVLVGRDPDDTAAAAVKLGWEEWSTDWKAVMARDDIDLVDISTPGYLHAPMAEEAAKQGKAILCEKPLANTLKEAKAMHSAAAKAGVPNMCGFTYRYVPAVMTIKNMVRNGVLGDIYHFRAAYLQDFIMDPSFPLIWRLQKKYAGSGALGDIGAHIVDMCHNILGMPIAEVCAAMQTFITERPVADADDGIDRKKRAGGKPKKGKVDVDDAVAFIARFAKAPTIATFTASRFCAGRRNNHTFEIYGSKGSITWDLEHMGFFEYYNTGNPDLQQGFTLVNATDPGHPFTEYWWPPAHNIGYEHCFSHEVYDFVTQLKKKRVTYPTFEDGVNCQSVLDAVERSAKSKKWEKV